MTPLSSCIDQAIIVRGEVLADPDPRVGKLLASTPPFRECEATPDPRVGKLLACTPFLSVVFVGTAGAERTPLNISIVEAMNVV